MVHYTAILPGPLVPVPVPAEMERFRIQHLTACYYENKACQLLRQTWTDPEANFYIQFTYINIRSASSLIATPARGNIAATLIYLLEGNIAVREQDSGTPLPRMEGDFYLRRMEKRNCRFTLDFGQPGTYQIVYISLSEKKLEALRQSEPIFQNKELLRSREIRQAGTWVKSIIKEMQGRQESSKDALDRYILRRTQRLFDSFIHIYDSSSIRWAILNPEERMEHLKVYIQNNLGSNLSLRALADMLHISEEGFRTFFRRETKSSLTAYVKKARVQEACRQLLLFPRKKLIDIASETGYESIKGLERAFRDIMHCSPRQYQHQQNFPDN